MFPSNPFSLHISFIWCNGSGIYPSRNTDLAWLEEDLSIPQSRYLMILAHTITSMKEGYVNALPDFPIVATDGSIVDV